MIGGLYPGGKELCVSSQILMAQFKDILVYNLDIHSIKKWIKNETFQPDIII
jgi:hypothetical protein